MTVARGTFEVKLVVQEPREQGAGAVGRLTLDKVFRGDLEGESRGEMLTVASAVAGSAGYVAMERFQGALHGRSGSFALAHVGTMNRGEPHLSITVVPDSGTDELTGLSGRLGIVIEGKAHAYELEYALPD